MTQPASQLQLPSTDEASAVLNRLYMDRFFAKLAEAGYVPQTEDGAFAALRTAMALDDVPLETPANDPMIAAETKLASYLQQHQPSGSLKQAAEAERVNHSLAAASDPDVYRAVLAVKAAQAAGAAGANPATPNTAAAAQSA